jgi:medium-chain acyl-[acyl-carrier-protein] hydrolase
MTIGQAISRRPGEPWITRPKPRSQAQLRLFCFPYAGGSASIYRAWPDDLPRTIEVCAVALPGRGGRLLEAPFHNLLPMVRALSDAIVPYLDRPFAFFGHSMGALVAFELARHLRRQRRPTPIHLFVSGRSAPQLRRPGSGIHRLPRKAFVEGLRVLNGTPPEVLQSEEMLEMLLPALLADFTACAEYVYTGDAPLECPISAYGGRDDPEVTEDELRAWRDQTLRPFTMRLFEGDHFFLRSASADVLATISVPLRAFTTS